VSSPVEREENAPIARSDYENRAIVETPRDLLTPRF
jgi:hypothetical protein